MRHRLQQAVLAGNVDADTLADGLEDRETWLPPLGSRSRRLLGELMHAVEIRREDVMQRLRRSPGAVATLFALLPATEMLALFGRIEMADERMLAETVAATPERSVLGVLTRARMGYMGAVAAMTRLMARVRQEARVPTAAPMN